MKNPKIFIASSTGALPLARQLRNGLRGHHKLGEVNVSLEVFLWKELVPPGGTITDSLRRKAQEVDFIVAVLTKDDLTHRKGIVHRVPRDNCIFEAGLFTGALGADYTRCFLVCGVEKEDLPTDLQELQHISIRGLNLSKRSARAMATKNAIREIVRAVGTRKDRCYDRPTVSVITKEDLLQWEAPAEEENGGKLVQGAVRRRVVVHATQPLERGYKFAKRVSET